MAKKTPHTSIIAVIIQGIRYMTFHDYKDMEPTFTINGWKIAVVVVGALCWIGIAYLFAIVALAFVP